MSNKEFKKASEMARQEYMSQSSISIANAFYAGRDWAYEWCQKNKLFEPYGDLIARKNKRIKELEAQLAVAREALEFYGQCRHFKITKVMGKIIEFDPDDGPLCEHYEEMSPTEERGLVARKALAQLDAKSESEVE